MEKKRTRKKKERWTTTCGRTRESKRKQRKEENDKGRGCREMKIVEHEEESPKTRSGEHYGVVSRTQRRWNRRRTSGAKCG